MGLQQILRNYKLYIYDFQNQSFTTDQINNIVIACTNKLPIKPYEIFGVKHGALKD